DVPLRRGRAADGRGAAAEEENAGAVAPDVRAVCGGADPVAGDEGARDGVVYLNASGLVPGDDAGGNRVIRGNHGAAVVHAVLLVHTVRAVRRLGRPGAGETDEVALDEVVLAAVHQDAVSAVVNDDVALRRRRAADGVVIAEYRDAVV